MSRERIAQIGARLSEIPPGTWHDCPAQDGLCPCELVYSETPDGGVLHLLDTAPPSETDAVVLDPTSRRSLRRFLVNAPTDIVWLLRELKEARALAISLAHHVRRDSPNEVIDWACLACLDDRSIRNEEARALAQGSGFTCGVHRALAWERE
jgi:hypothetical protein